MANLNLHNLLCTQSSEYPNFLKNITVGEDDRLEMLNARTAIRRRLSKELPDRLRKKAIKAGLEIPQVPPKPHFFTQGSWAYKTMNAPCRAPQQADLDDGVYLPFSYIESQPPAQMSSLLFEAAEEVLGELANEQGWKLDINNSNCTRLCIADDKHIDVPVYSIPDDEFETLEKAQSALIRSALESYSLDSTQFAEQEEEQQWELMPTNGVLMATKDRGWQDSDPRPVRDWVARQVELKGEQLRRVMRYLKAWRDFQHWEKDDPKSILLMVAADAAFERDSLGRDDLALLDVLKRLPNILRGKVISPSSYDKPVHEQEDLAERLDKKDIREEVIQRLTQFSNELERAIFEVGDPSTACQILIAELGDRIPNEPARVTNSTVLSETPRLIPTIKPLGSTTAG